jgi:hypothetical protein
MATSNPAQIYTGLTDAAPVPDRFLTLRKR